MTETNNQTIGQIVANDYRAAQVFRSHKLDFCCGGNRTVEEACAKKGIDPNEVYQGLDALIQNTETGQDNYKAWSPEFLVDYIINNHHEFTRSKLPEIGAYAHKVAKVHGGRHPELKEIYREFAALQSELMSHLEKEEQVLFPYIKQLAEADDNGRNPEAPHFGEVSNPIAMMEFEHDEAGGRMKKIRELSDNFTLPQDACTTYRILFQNLEAFERDLHKHVHLENNILFPKAIALEKALRQN